MGNASKSAGIFPWFLQRVTAILLAYFLAMHIIIIHFLKKGTITFEAVTSKIAANPLFYKFFYYIFIPALVYHALNGVWSVFLDYKPPERVRKIIAVILWITGAGLTVAGMITVNALMGGGK